MIIANILLSYHLSHSNYYLNLMRKSIFHGVQFGIELAILPGQPWACDHPAQPTIAEIQTCNNASRWNSCYLHLFSDYHERQFLKITTDCNSPELLLVININDLVLL